MADLTADPNDPELGHGGGGEGQNPKYLVAPAWKRKFKKRAVRRTYLHTTCGTTTTMATALAETYAHDPKFYGYTFCVRCNSHFPVHEFLWCENSGQPTNEVVGS